MELQRTFHLKPIFAHLVWKAPRCGKVLFDCTLLRNSKKVLSLRKAIFLTLLSYSFWPSRPIRSIQDFLWASLYALRGWASGWLCGNLLGLGRGEKLSKLPVLFPKYFQLVTSDLGLTCMQYPSLSRMVWKFGLSSGMGCQHWHMSP